MRRLLCAFAKWLGSISTTRAETSSLWNEIDSRMAGWETRFCPENEDERRWLADYEARMEGEAEER